MNGTEIGLLKDVPDVEARDAVVSEPYPYGAGTYRIIVEKITEEEYESYLKVVEEAGFQLVERTTLANELVTYAIFRKNKCIFTITYYPRATKIWMAVSDVLLDKGWNASELFQNVPNVSEKDAVHYGAGNYVITKAEQEMWDYEEYLETLETAGFEKYVDNGDVGLADAVYSTIYTKEEMVLTITYVVKLKKIYISACKNLPLSEHLFYPKEDVLKNAPDAKTILHMLELWWFGNSFVIQLKNGHFLISDGGFTHEIGYMLDYLDTLTPENEKPIVEGWFISHGHSDHCSILRRFVETDEYIDRIAVEGIYYNEPSDSVIALDVAARDDVMFNRLAAEHLKNSEGGHPKLYRPQTGQRYFFNDVTVDIVFGQEQLAVENYSGDFNDSSTWCMFTIEGQKCLLGGDGDKGAIKFIMDTYEQEYMKVDVFTLLHHGWNVWDYFIDFCTVKSVLNTRVGAFPERRVPAIAYMKEHVEEWIERDGGTKVLTFPYEVGTYETKPPFKWIYHEGIERP